MTRRICLNLVVALLSSLIAAACGESDRSPSPTGPSTVPASPPSLSSGSATSSGSAPAHNSGAAPASQGAFQATSKDLPQEVEGEGRVTSLVSGCPTPQFVAEGITVKTSATTVYEGGTCADIQVGRKVEAKGTRQMDGSVLASRIRVQN